MRHIRVPHQIPAQWPLERGFVPVRRRHTALKLLPNPRAVPLPVYQPGPLELQRPLPVLARGVLRVRAVAWRVRGGGWGGAAISHRGMVGGEVHGGGGGGEWGGGFVGSALEGGGGEEGRGSGGGGAAVLPRAEEVEEGAEEGDDREAEDFEFFPVGEGGLGLGGGGVVGFWW